MCGTLKSLLGLSLSKLSQKMNLGYIDNFEIKIERTGRCCAHFSDNPEFGHFMSTCCLITENDKEIYQEL